MASITPNEDRLRAIRLPDAALAREGEPGQGGVDARVVNALTTAYGIALAREIDLGTDHRLIPRAFAAAVANVLAGVALSLGRSPDDLAGLMLGWTACDLGSVMAQSLKGDIQSVKIERVARA